MGPLYRELVVYSNRSCFVSNEAQKSSEGKQRCPLNGRDPIHIAVLKAVKKASTGFVGETTNSSGSLRQDNEWREHHVSMKEDFDKATGIEATKTNEPWCGP